MPDKIPAKIAARVRQLVERIYRTGIELDEIPAIVGACFDLAETVIEAGDDGRLTLAEVASIWSSICRLRDQIEAARKV